MSPPGQSLPREDWRKPSYVSTGPYSTADCVATVKLAWEGNDNDNFFFYENNVQLKAFEDVTFVKTELFPKDKDGNPIDYDKIALFVDLGRTPAGETVEIKDIHFLEK